MSNPNSILAEEIIAVLQAQKLLSPDQDIPEFKTKLLNGRLTAADWENALTNENPNQSNETTKA